MFGLFGKRNLLDDELAGWQFDVFAWLLRHTGGFAAFGQRRGVFPTSACFPHSAEHGHALAEAMFDQVRAHAGMADWPCVVQPQEHDPDPLVGPALLVQGAPQSPAGTYRGTEDGALITYHPRQLGDPMALVATFAHELAHYRTERFPEPPPGGWDVWEPATDLAAVFLGFGIFLANAHFRFSQHSDGQTMGWQSQRQGYLSEPEILHMQAIFSNLLELPAAGTLPHLKPALRGMFKRLYREVAAATGELEKLRAIMAARPVHSVMHPESAAAS